MSEWKEGLPEQLREAPYFKNAESVDQVLADLTNAAQWQGNSIRIPGPDAPAEDITSWEAKVTEKYPGLRKIDLEDADSVAATLAYLGTPEAADAYKAPDGIDLSPEDMGSWKAIAKQAGMTQAQFTAMLTEMGVRTGKAKEEATNKLTEAWTALQGEWGAATEQRLAGIGKLLEGAPDGIKQALANKTLPADQVRWLHSLAEAISNEDVQLNTQDPSGDPRLTPDEIDAQADELIRKMSGPDVTTEEQARLNRKLVEILRQHPANAA